MSMQRGMPDTASPLSAAAVPFLEDLYQRYTEAPESVDASWQAVFRLVGELAHEGGRTPGGAELLRLVEHVRLRGHLAARLDPLGRGVESGWEALVDAARRFPPPAVEDIEVLRSRYCGTLAVETAHIDDPALRDWLCRRVEEPEAELDPHTLVEAQRRLIEADEFERFMGRRFTGKKRFGADGAESFVLLMDRLLRAAAADGVEQVVIGGMHRGRLNLLANILKKPLAPLFAEFKGLYPYSGEATAAADVSYHLSWETELSLDGRSLQVLLLPNPSHLEAVDPVALGRTRARQDMLCDAGATRDEAAAKVLGIVLHTDASVIAQGLVAEILQLSGVAAFHTGGTVHVVINNQLGFTTEPEEGRSSRHCTGQWKAIDAAIVHVNGDDPEAVLRAADIALDFRQSHRRDAVVDLVCYRRHGHNEADEPRFTQPGLYRTIADATPVVESFRDRLVGRGLWTSADDDRHRAEARAALDAGYEAMEHYRPNASGYPGGAWTPFVETALAGRPVEEPDTGVAAARLEALLAQIATVPDGLALDAKLTRLVQERGDRNAIPWAVAEALAFGSLLTAGTPVRLTGQDIVRGAFSHRHFALTDTVTGRRHVTLDHLEPDQARFSVHNSPLSEYGVLGFEFGYSVERPDALTLWEAQFGDFSNVAQVIVDQFVTSCEDKWHLLSGLVLLLPHGFEGQGPEHSSARIERYLQLAARDNMRVVNVSTPANYFHLLRGQVLRRARKPLVVFAPKKLLRLPEAVSTLAEFTPGHVFRSVIAAEPSRATKRLLLCSGKIAYDLERERAQRGADDVAIVRLEQLYPLPAAALGAIFARAPRARIVWVQEECENMGAWSWLDRRLEGIAAGAGHRAPRPVYCGRPEGTSPAGSFHSLHESDQAAIVARAFA